MLFPFVAACALEVTCLVFVLLAAVRQGEHHQRLSPLPASWHPHRHFATLRLQGGHPGHAGEWLSSMVTRKQVVGYSYPVGCKGWKE